MTRLRTGKSREDDKCPVKFKVVETVIKFFDNAPKEVDISTYKLAEDLFESRRAEKKRDSLDEEAEKEKILQEDISRKRLYSEVFKKINIPK